MSNDESNPERPPTPEELQADVDRTFSALMEAVSRYAAAVSIRSWSRGWDAGWVKSRESFMEALLKRTEATESTPAPAPPQPPPPPAVNVGNVRSLTAADLVVDFIAKNPGKRGVEIASGLGAWDSPKGIPERTVRTALHRLKGKKIEIVDGRWYTREAAAALPRQHQLIEDNDGPP